MPDVCLRVCNIRAGVAMRNGCAQNRKKNENIASVCKNTVDKCRICDTIYLWAYEFIIDTILLNHSVGVRLWERSNEAATSILFCADECSAKRQPMIRLCWMDVCANFISWFLFCPQR